MGKYQLIRKLATGGMAEVFLAKAAGPMGFEKTLVVKRILPHLAEDPQFIEMFLAEAKLAALLNHANIAQIFDFGDEDGSSFIAMEYIDGSNLRILSRRAFELKTPIAFPLCAKLVSFACEGLAYAHELTDPDTGEPLGLIHRDISPDNVMVSRNGGVKVVDFGIAKAANQLNHTRNGVLKGKLSYMSPEQIKAEPLDLRVDVYALGVVLYEMVVGRKPFDAESEVGLMRAIIEEPLRPAGTRREGVPAELDRIIDKALAKPRNERYASCRAFQADLERFLIRHGEPVGAFQVSELVKALAPPGSDKGAQPTPRRSNPALPIPQRVVPPPPPVETSVGVSPMAVEPRESQETQRSSAQGKPRKPAGVWVAAGALLIVGAGGYLGWRLQGPSPSPPAAEPLAPPTVATPRPAEPGQDAEAKAPAQERQDGPSQLASFVVESVPPGDIRVDGKPVGASPARVTGVTPGELRIEASGPGFAREERVRVKSGDNGVLRILAEKGTMKIRGIPEETPVTLDGRLLGSFPAPQTLYEGPHRIQVVDPQTGKTLEFDCPKLPPHESRICKFKLGTE